jgi:hypothetical protein
MEAPAATILCPVTRDYPSRSMGGFFMPPKVATVLSRNEEDNLPFCIEKKEFLLLNLFTDFKCE